MKTIFKTTAAIFAITKTACSSDDDTKVKVSERLEYEYAIEQPIPDFSVPAYISIPVEEEKTIIDPTKVYVEISLEHDVAADLSYGYKMPNNSTEYTMVNCLGGFNKYNKQNALSFNPSHTEVLKSDNSMYPNGIIPQGNYNGGGISEDFPAETPMFNSMLNKSIKGTWKFFVKDNFELDEGKLVKIKLIFDEGALEVTNN